VAFASRRRGGGRGGGRAWRPAGARARGGGGGLLEEGEGKGAEVGRADREADAQEEWGWLGHSGGLGEKVGRADLAARLKQRNKSFPNFKLNFGIWLDFENLSQEI
jgi:hypothetical protein